jgi:hypothetical protein
LREGKDRRAQFCKFLVPGKVKGRPKQRRVKDELSKYIGTRANKRLVALKAVFDPRARGDEAALKAPKIGNIEHPNFEIEHFCTEQTMCWLYCQWLSCDL